VLRFDANLTYLFGEAAFYDRFALAREAGFTHVEFLDVFQFDLTLLRKAVADAGLHIVQFNVLDGDMPAGERGFASHPDQRPRWRAALERAMDVADRLHPIQMHSLVGVTRSDVPRADQLATLTENLRWAVPLLERAGRPLMLEPLNLADNPDYLIPHVEDALRVIQAVASPWLRLQFDCYHVQRAQGDLIRRLTAAAPYLGHVQIADNPGRGHPGSGEIHYRNVLHALESLGYDRYIGLEYRPSPDTLTSLAWLPRPARSAGCAAGELNIQ
jgi:hydroxypyruvate isomerase